MLSDERYKQLMEAVGMPNSHSLLAALQQCAMEATLNERALWVRREMLLIEKLNSLREVVEAMHEWIDAVPNDAVLPAMPGFDRDWADDIINQSRSKLESLQEQPQIAYEKYEFCRSMNCPEIVDKTHCDVFLHDCLFTAKRFHQWLQCHNFKIIKENTNEHRNAN